MKIIKGINWEDLQVEKFIGEKITVLRRQVGDGVAIHALSGGVDSSVMTALAHKARGDRLQTYFIDTGLMRQGEPRRVAANSA